MRYGQHKPKLTNETAAARGWKPMEVDRMPATVATDLLCSLERITNPYRKMYVFARVTLWQSAATPKPRDKKMAAKFKNATLCQLFKWERRAKRQRRTLQYRFRQAQAMPEENNVQVMKKHRIINALDFAAGVLDEGLDALKTELAARTQ